MATNNAVNTTLVGQSGNGAFAGDNSPTITTPRIVTSILDVNGNTLLGITATASAVDYLTLVNQIGGANPGFVAQGTSSNIGVGWQTKGTGAFTLLTGALTTPLILVSGTSGQHTTNFAFGNTANSRTVTFPDATGTLLMTGQAISTVPSIAFSSTSGVIGTTTNDNAAAGSVGQFVSSVIASGSAVSIPSNNAVVNVTQINLDAGDWDVWGNVAFNISTTCSAIAGCISSTSATLPDRSLYALVGSTAVGTILSGAGMCVPSLRFSLTGVTTIYLIANALFSAGTVAACGGIYARRVR